VLKRTLEVPREIARSESSQTELAIAVALPDEQAEEQEDSSARYPVFAFLPVQPYGLRFILQGDFVLASGRESIRQDNSWNQWLRNEIPGLFLDAVDKAKEEGSPLPIQLVLNVLPTEGEVHTFFKSSVKILDLICSCVYCCFATTKFLILSVWLLRPFLRPLKFSGD
jgi:hypothetical protein